LFPLRRWYNFYAIQYFVGKSHNLNLRITFFSLSSHYRCFLDKREIALMSKFEEEADMRVVFGLVR
jgi:hypothetical protein